MVNPVNQSPFLRSSREFPLVIADLAQESNKAYLETATAVNLRTIGLFPVNRPAITGESWFLSGNQRQQTLRQVYTFTSTANINIGFKLSSTAGFSRLFGVYTNGTSFFGLIAGSDVAIAGQISFYLTVNVSSTTSDVITFLTGAGAPTLVSGQVVIEWLSFV